MENHTCFKQVDRKSKAFTIAELVHESWKKPVKWNTAEGTGFEKELFSKSLIMRSGIGKRIGSKAYLHNYYDWLKAFPDLQVTLTNLRQYGNVVIATVKASGTHLGHLVDSFQEESQVIHRSPFMTSLMDCEPSKAKICYFSDCIFVFQGNKVCEFYSHSNISASPELLKLLHSSRKHSNQDEICKKINGLLPVPLSNQELECLALNLCGFSAKQIGGYKCISRRTVETHIACSYSKIGCLNKHHFAEMIYEKGILHLWQEVCQEILKRCH